MPDGTLCEHPNEVPHTCTCVPDCYCRGRMCDPVTPTVGRTRWDVLQEDALLEPDQE